MEEECRKVRISKHRGWILNWLAGRSTVAFTRYDYGHHIIVFTDHFFSAVNKEDRSVIRSRLLESGIEEYDQRLALQNALVVAKIVRFEYPNDWYTRSLPCPSKPPLTTS